MADTSNFDPAVVPVTAVLPPKKAVVFPATLSRTIIIKRKPISGALPETGVSTEADRVLRIGSGYAAGTTRPLGRTIFTVEEEALYMPTLLGIQPNHPEWSGQLDAYWHNISRPVPLSGLILEVGKIYQSREEYDEDQKGGYMTIKGSPLNVADYLLWRYCLKYSAVANRIEDMHKSDRILFYIHDEAQATRTKVSVRKIKDDANRLRYQHENDSERMTAVIYCFNQVVPTNPIARSLLFADLADQYPQQFITIVSDSLLLEKGFVEACIAKGLLNRPVNSTLILYNGDTQVGNNINEAIVFLSDPKNTVIRSTLQSQLNH